MLLGLIIVVVLVAFVAGGLVLDRRSRRLRAQPEANERDSVVATAELSRLDRTAELAKFEGGAPYVAEETG